MKAISLWQPWASLWICGSKIFETRHWSTRHRGPLAVHAAQKICVDIDPALSELCVQQFGAAWAKSLPRGAALGYGELTNCYSTNRITVNDIESLQGNFSADRYAWELSARAKFAHPVPYRGMQSMFEIPDELIYGFNSGVHTHPQGKLI